MESPHSLSTRLADALPRDVAITAQHLSTPPTKTSPIFSAAPGQPEETTFCESHFLTLATPKTESRGEILIFAIEILIFTTPALTTVFVSKADSTGYSSLLQVPKDYPSITRSTVEAFIRFLLDPRLTESRVTLSLFARSQDQYLFPGSIENVEKHVLDDRQLIKWWCRVLDAVWRPYDAGTADQQISAHVLVPGTEGAETRSFFPPSIHQDGRDAPRWSHYYPVKLLTVDDSLPPRCLIPRLPDDPKARFLNDLDGDYIGEDGHWRNVRSLDQFWEFMSYRQECSAGRLVGFIWVTFVRPQLLLAKADDAAKSISTTLASQISDGSVLPTPEDSQRRSMVDLPPAIADELATPERPKSPPPSSPPSAEAATKDESQAGQSQTVVGTTEEVVNAVDGRETEPCRPVDVRWPASTRGQVVTDLDTYDELLESLLRLDFAGQQLAAESTDKWVALVKKQTETQDFGASILGKATPAKSLGTATANGSISAPQVTTLTGVRKKRKVEDAAPAVSVVGDLTSPSATVLSAGLVRKKPKTG
ncbi:uncharacterized protein HMPREF1541_10210 [Cyphellophora europaea CBS 101466]|uniref:histone acetyltransferase n=1 Tax=Cyphellophora europaea (strain CBS 101466) TaxID=1220924 RepID=W2S7D6_CYPE1|nr:uncharacterized protein HMPREF1541_10210 [Cyphellophora europaea CBS 101466]ETN44540.1 hypothetical protein HMPREF1541_10210 [Cyphellophora europaea CBS 101466]